MIPFLTMPYSETIGCFEDFFFPFTGESLISDFEDRTMSKCTVLFIYDQAAHRYIKLYA